MSAIGQRPSAISSALLGATLLCGNAFAQEDEMGWPREIEDPRARIVIYQPQVDSFVGNDLSARAAISVTLTGKTEPVFGAAWIGASAINCCLGSQRHIQERGGGRPARHGDRHHVDR